MNRLHRDISMHRQTLTKGVDQGFRWTHQQNLHADISGTMRSMNEDLAFAGTRVAT